MDKRKGLSDVKMTEKYKVHVLLDLRDQYGDPIPGFEPLLEDDDIEVTYAKPRQYDTLSPEDLEGANAAISMVDEITDSSLQGVDTLEFVVRTGAGFENLDVSALTDHGIVAAHAPQGPTESVAQSTVGMLITCAHNLRKFDHLVRTDPEEAVLNRADYMGHELQNQSLGIIGMGQIGKRVVELVDPFGIDIQVYDPYLPSEEAAQLGVRLVKRDELLQTADYISLHVPLTDETRNMLGEEEFKLMKESACLLNTSRGGLYEDKVLARALREGWIGGAAIDVFEDEPFIKDNPLREIDNALLTPHISGITHEAMERIMSISAQGVLAMKDGKLPENIINPEVIEGAVPDNKLSPAYIPE
ncbi:NAD(P)-dependent oxidoreductase [Natrialbaceae archaeon A-CW1-1]